MKKENNIINDNNNTTNSSINQNENDNNYNLENDAFTLKRKAENKLNPGCCMDTLFTSKSKRYEDACELYKKAGDKYKICSQWRKAGDCFENCANIKIKLKDNPVNYYQESFFCYSKADSDNNSKKIFGKMNQYLARKGEYFQAGKNNENLAIKMENNDKYNDAIFYYLEASNYYELDGKHESLKNKIDSKIAELMMINNYHDASKKVPTLLENIGNNCLNNSLTKYSAKDYFGKSILSLIYYSNNPSEIEMNINKYKEIDKTFEGSEIYNLCNNSFNAMKNKDINMLKISIKKYKEVNELDEFMIDIFNKLEEKIKKESQLGQINENNSNYEEDLK